MNERELHQARAARNQSLFREINNNVVELNEAFEALAGSSVFVCECARMDCIEQIELTLSEYGRVHANPRRFVVAPSAEHVLPGVEYVAESHASYFVVEKIEVAAQVAEEQALQLGA